MRMPSRVVAGTSSHVDDVPESAENWNAFSGRCTCPVSHNEDACRLYGKAFVQSVFGNPKRNKIINALSPRYP